MLLYFQQYKRCKLYTGVKRTVPLKLQTYRQHNWGYRLDECLFHITSLHLQHLDCQVLWFDIFRLKTLENCSKNQILQG